MNKWKVVAGIFLIFALGGLTGTIGTGMFFKSRIRQFMNPKGPPPPIRVLHRELDRMDLSEDRRIEIDILLDEMHREAAKHMRQSVPQLKELFDQYTLKIKEKLDPVQQGRLDKTLERVEKRMMHMKPLPPPKPGDLHQPPRFREEAGGFQENDIGPMGPPFMGQTGDIPTPGHFQEELDLTPEQVEKSDAILEEMRERRHAIRIRFNKERRQKIRAFESEITLLNEETKSKLSTVLSEDQMDKLESMGAEE